MPGRNGANTGFDTIERYVAECGGRPVQGRRGAVSKVPGPVNFHAVADTWMDGQAFAKARIDGAAAALFCGASAAKDRVPGEYVRRPGSAVGVTAANAGGMKEIDCYV